MTKREGPGVSYPQDPEESPGVSYSQKQRRRLRLRLRKFSKVICKSLIASTHSFRFVKSCLPGVSMREDGGGGTQGTGAKIKVKAKKTKLPKPANLMDHKSHKLNPVSSL